MSVLVCVPKILEVLRDYVVHLAPETAAPLERSPSTSRGAGGATAACTGCSASSSGRFVRRRGRRSIPEVEAFWSRLGFLVVQGYGLTETAPIVTLNHPFRTRRGSVGKPIAGIEIRIADDGEILVRGDNVTSGYYNAPGATAAAFRDGWFHTGDVGTLDAEGRLTVQGRKKEMIVTPDGLNVFPEDVERVVLERAGVRDAAAVAGGPAGREHVHAVLLLGPATDPAAVVRDANARLEEHQRIRAFSVWPGAALPRTDGTQKLKRRELKRWVDGDDGAAPPGGAAAGAGAVEEVLSRFAHGRAITGATTLEELGLSSLERIELALALERQFDPHGWTRRLWRSSRRWTTSGTCWRPGRGNRRERRLRRSTSRTPFGNPRSRSPPGASIPRHAPSGVWRRRRSCCRSPASSPGFGSRDSIVWPGRPTRCSTRPTTRA